MFLDPEMVETGMGPGPYYWEAGLYFTKEQCDVRKDVFVKERAAYGLEPLEFICVAYRAEGS